MSKDPAVLFYTSDFLTGTMTMTNEQTGKYIRLLCLQHQKGMLDEQDMLHVCGTYDERIFSKFIKQNGCFYNERMEKESLRRKEFCESRRLSRMSHVRQTCVQRMETENENETVNTNIIKKKGVKGEKGRFIPPTLEEVIEYCSERKSTVDPETFFNKGQGNGWVDKNGNKYKDWKAVIRTWEKWTKSKQLPEKELTEKEKYAIERRKQLDGLGTEISNL